MLFRDIIDAYSENHVQKIDHSVQCQINPVSVRLIFLRCCLLLHFHLVHFPPGSPLPFTFSNESFIRFSGLWIMNIRNSFQPVEHGINIRIIQKFSHRLVESKLLHHSKDWKINTVGRNNSFLYIGTSGVYIAKLLNSEADDAFNNKVIIEEESIENWRNLYTKFHVGGLHYYCLIQRSANQFPGAWS